MLTPSLEIHQYVIVAQGSEEGVARLVGCVQVRLMQQPRVENKGGAHLTNQKDTLHLTRQFVFGSLEVFWIEFVVM
jgi:hypothetical protein